MKKKRITRTLKVTESVVKVVNIESNELSEVTVKLIGDDFSDSEILANAENEVIKGIKIMSKSVYPVKCSLTQQDFYNLGDKAVIEVNDNA